MEAMREPDAGAAFPSDTRDERARCSGTLRAPRRLRGTARRWVVGVSVAATVVISGGHTVFAQRPPGVGQSDQAISSLRVGDFDGLVRLDTLDLSSNYLTAFP